MSRLRAFTIAAFAAATIAAASHANANTTSPSEPLTAGSDHAAAISAPQSLPDTAVGLAAADGCGWLCVKVWRVCFCA